MEENRLTDLKGTVESGLLYVEWCVRVCMCRLMPVHISVMVWGNAHTQAAVSAYKRGPTTLTSLLLLYTVETYTICVQVQIFNNVIVI